MHHVHSNRKHSRQNWPPLTQPMRPANPCTPSLWRCLCWCPAHGCRLYYRCPCTRSPHELRAITVTALVRPSGLTAAQSYRWSSMQRWPLDWRAHIRACWARSFPGWAPGPWNRRGPDIGRWHAPLRYRRWLDARWAVPMDCSLGTERFAAVSPVLPSATVWRVHFAEQWPLCGPACLQAMDTATFVTDLKVDDGQTKRTYRAGEASQMCANSHWKCILIVCNWRKPVQSLLTDYIRRSIRNTGDVNSRHNEMHTCVLLKKMYIRQYWLRF